MKVYQISKPKSKEYLKNLGVSDGGIDIIANKMDLFFIEIKELKAPAVNILKQDALSIGAELAVPSGAILCDKENYDCLLIGTKKELSILAKKELAQPFGLKEVAKKIKEIINYKEFPIKIMGVLNINNDSFYNGSRFSQKEAIKAINKMVDDGAKIIDIGAVSSRPGSKPVSQDEELARIKSLLDTIKEQKLYEIATFSIDSYAPTVIRYALDSGFSIINDITGARDIEVIKLAKEYNSKLCIMHMQGTPQTMQLNPSYECVTYEVDSFFENQINKCEEIGVSKDNIILDVGIGFGKSLEHNITLLKNHEHFRHFGCELLIGASRKSMIDKIYPSNVEDRLPGTLAIHLSAISKGATIVRCHDVKEHTQAIKVWQRLK